MKAEHEDLSKRFASRESREDRFQGRKIAPKMEFSRFCCNFCGFFPIELKAFGGKMEKLILKTTFS